MKPDSRNPAMTTRREILTRCARWGSLLALGGIAARLGWNGGGKCDRPSPCGGCPLFAGCALPKAAETLQQPPPATPSQNPTPIN